MAGETKIEWTARRLPDGRIIPGGTFNPWVGCTKVSPACDHCYAERDADTRRGFVKWGPPGSGGTRRVTSDDYWRGPERWARKAHAAGVRMLVFTASWADVFEDWPGHVLTSSGQTYVKGGGLPFRGVDRPGPGDAPVTLGDLRDRLWRLMARTSHAIDWLVLTKRSRTMVMEWPLLAETYARELEAAAVHHPALRPALDHFRRTGLAPNIWPGVTVENQEWADRRVPDLLGVSAPYRFVSAEPLVGPVVMMRPTAGVPDRHVNWLNNPDPADPIGGPGSPGVHWVITGGESGPAARGGHPARYRSLRDQCASVGAAFFYKQHGDVVAVDQVPDSCRTEAGTMPLVGGQFVRLGRRMAGRLLDGVEHSAMPAAVL